MNSKEHFDRSVAVLVKAFFEGTLVGQSCAACACGNLIAAANNLTITPGCAGSGLEERFMWAELAPLVMQAKESRDPHSIWDGETNFPSPAEMMAACGYSPAQFERIEAAFMGWKDGVPFDNNLAGLLRVTDELADIHGIDLTTAAAAKALFVRA